MIRVLLADDQALVRAGFRSLLESEDDVEVVGEAGTGREAVELARAERPDVVLMDIRMPELDGLEATRAIMEDPELDAVRVVILTTFDLDEYVFEALRIGACGFLVKDTEPADLVRGVRGAARGEAMLSPGVVRKLVTAVARTDEPSPLHTGPERDRVLATLMFSDIVASTERAATVGDRRWRELLDRHDARARDEVARHGGREIKMTGDGMLAMFDAPARAIRCALALRERVRALGIDVRIGLHAGEIELRGGGDVGGIAVHIGSRVADVAGPGDVVVSSTVKDLAAGSGIAFEDRGVRALKGVPEPWHLFAVAGPGTR
jgi:DNA-binding NarL/FixJ family response regulator